MKKLLLVLMIIVLAIIKNFAAHLTSSIQVTARCNGMNEVPAVTTDGQGLAVLTVSRDMLTAKMIFQATNLTGPITGIHIHDGSSDENGPVLVNLTPFLDGLSLETTLSNSSSFSIKKLIAGEYYLNVHTEANPGGEIRGQLNTETDLLFSGILSGLNEVPSVSTDATGYAALALSSSGNTYQLNAVFEGLSSPIVGAHLHIGEAGTNGGVAVDLSANILDSTIVVDFTSDAEFAAALKAGQVYLNIHTVLNPGGEIRAQLVQRSVLSFDVALSGDNEVPSVSSASTGIMTFSLDLEANILSYTGFFKSTSSAVTGAHIHLGGANENGPVVINLSNDIDGQFITGSTNKLTSALLDAMLTGGSYVNIHTEDYPSGELRGQITRLLREGYVTHIDSTQSISGTSSTATGVSMISIDRNQTNGHFMAVVNGIADDFQAAHFHDGGPGETGDVIFDIGPFVIDASGAYGYWENMGDAAVKFRTSGVYINFHTTEFPGGAVRGDYSRGSSLNVGTPDFNRAQLFVSSNTQCLVGALVAGYNGESTLYTAQVEAMDADGIYFANKSDALYQVNRSSNRIDKYDNVLEAIFHGETVSKSLHSSSDFVNGRELAVGFNQFIVAQDANDSNDQTNALFVYEEGEDTISLVKQNTTDINLWGIQMVDSTLWAIEDNSSNVAYYENFLDQPEGEISATGKVSVENLVRTHGLFYDVRTDVMYLTDVGEASSAEDGAIVIVNEWSVAIADDVISADEQVRIEGANTELGNPVDIAYDMATNLIWVAERANAGGKILAFSAPSEGGDITPDESIPFAGASAVYFNSTRNAGEFTPVDPGFDGQLLFAGRLSGSNEVPEVESDAVGVIGIRMNEEMDMASVNLSINGLGSTFSGVHLHKAPAGENGDVILNLTDAFENNIIRTEATIGDDLLTDMLSGDIYVNVHSESQASGEIRAQVLLEKDRTFVNWINGDQEVPAIDGEAKGLVSANLTGVLNMMEIRAFFTDLTGDVTGAHLHNAAAGENGGVVLNLTDFVCENNRIEANVDVSPFIDELLAGNIYLNVHTAENPGGEIRAQLTEWTGISADGWIAGEQSVPMVLSAGLGLAAVNLSPDRSTMTVWAVSDYLSSEVQAAHLHIADQGENGGVWINLAEGLNGSDIELTVTEFDATMLNAFLKGDVYLNIHTPNNPAGEIRGQLYPNIRQGYNFGICQEQEVHDVLGAEEANGGGIVSIDRNNSNLHLMTVVSNTSGPVTGAHLHQAPEGMDGGVILNLTNLYENGGIFTYQATENFASEIGTPILDGNVYINYHTEANPSGELRGQVVNDISCPISTFVFNEQNISFNVNIFPNPAQDFLNVEWDEKEGENLNLIIRSINGQTLVQQNLTGNRRVNLGSLNPGMYILELRTKDERAIAKFSKM
ncbi:CHRD domain-containing protein [Portibacter marinus]|uniref:CHRD domain-containing protein n=1 Tax=Portibacter marinus TaxID=2898660 RepID=UPI001F168899|nr:CHRD domain-containing protein [Portibacter marinus]